MPDNLSKFLRQHAIFSLFVLDQSKIDTNLAKHLPFLFWIIEKNKPKIIVQLGANNPTPFYGYCYAINELKLKSRIFVIDLLNSEQETYSTNVYYGDILPNFFLDEFRLFTNLLHRTFEDAVHSFNHNTIDLLHISGALSAEHIKKILALWKEKLSDQSIILIDNLNNLPQEDLNKFCGDLQNSYPSLSFSHAKGLGVISDKSLLKNSTTLSRKIHAFYENLGLPLQEMINNKVIQQENLQKDLAFIEIELIIKSLSWRITKPLRYLSQHCRSIATLPLKIKYMFGKIFTYFSPQISTKLKIINNTFPVCPTTLLGLQHFKSNAKIAVILHIFYPDIWQELHAALKNIDEPFDLFVSLIKDNSEGLIETIKHTYSNAFIHIFPNQGRDVLPFILYINTSVFTQYDAVLKLHTKKSLHMKHGNLWRSRTYHALAGSKQTTKKIIQSMRNNKNIGLVGAPNSICGKKHWAGSEKQTIALAKRMSCHVDPDSLQFIGSTMFWINPLILKRLQTLHLSISDFEIEKGQLRETTAHHIERLIGILCKASGMKILETPEILNECSMIC